MAVSIRDATAEDLPAILAISNEAIANTTANWDITPETLDDRRAWLAQRTADGMPVLVACGLDGVVAGFASYGSFRTRDGYAATVEHSIYVDPAAQGEGAGTALMEALIERARAAGMHVMVGGLDGANEGSLRFHERLGFTTTATIPEVGRKFDRWLDLVFVTLVL